jgi:hypothetical protein
MKRIEWTGWKQERMSLKNKTSSKRRNYNVSGGKYIK